MKKTFCIFSANYLPNIGGVEKYTYNIAKALSARGNSVIIVTNNCYELVDYEELEENISIFRLPCFPLLNGRLPIPKFSLNRNALLKKLRNESIDYVMINTRFYPHSFTGVHLAKRMGITPILLDHGSDYITFNNAFLDIFVKFWEHLSATLLKRYSPDFYAVSLAGIEWLKTFKIEAKGTLNNAIDADDFVDSSSGRNFRKELNISESDFVVSFIGRFIPEKGVTQLLKAAEHLSNQKDVKFLFGGVGPMEKDINECLNKNVFNLGILSGPDVSALLIDSDVFCLPSRSEGFATSLLEASACGTPSIITKVGGTKELIPTDQFGILLDSNNSNVILRAIMELKGNNENRKRISDSVYKKVREEFSWEKTAEKVEMACRKANKN